METKMIDLTIIEAKQITGGDLYSAGYAVGRYWANTVDFWEGIYNGFMSNQ